MCLWNDSKRQDDWNTRLCQIRSCFEFVKTLYRRFFRVNCAQTLHEKPVWVLFFQLKIALHKNHCKWFSMQRKELLINFTKTSTSTELAQKKNIDWTERKTEGTFSIILKRKELKHRRTCALQRNHFLFRCLFFFWILSLLYWIHCCRATQNEEETK